MQVTKRIASELTDCLKELHLPTVRECYREQADMARRESLGYEAYLLSIVEREREVRWQNRIVRLTKGSKLPLEKTLESFDRKRLPKRVDDQVSTLLEG